MPCNVAKDIRLPQKCFSQVTNFKTGLHFDFQVVLLPKKTVKAGCNMPQPILEVISALMQINPKSLESD